jgi:hypothetical protein
MEASEVSPSNFNEHHQEVTGRRGLIATSHFSGRAARMSPLNLCASMARILRLWSLNDSLEWRIHTVH